VVVLTCLLGWTADAAAQRDYFISPRGTQSITVSGQLVGGNQSFDGYQHLRGSRTDQNVAVFQYSRAIALGDHRAGVLAVQPMGKVDGSVELSTGALGQSSSGMGDLQVGATYAIAGPPPMTREEYVQWRPGFAATIVMMMSAPTGDYEAAKLLNMGGNRWTFSPSVAMVQYVGKSLVDPDLVTLELKPGFTFFAPNDEPYGGGKTRQEPLFTLEAHATKGFAPGVWGSFGVYFKYGGRVHQADGTIGDPQNAYRLGAALSYALTPTLNAKLVYISNAWTSTNENAVERSLRAAFAYTF
jgi:hypothetical protein